MEAEDFSGFFTKADIIFPEGQKYSDIPKLEALRKEASNVPVCRPEAVLACMWSGENGQSESTGPAGESRRNGKCPVFTTDRKDRILEIMIEYMDRYSQGDEGDELRQQRKLWGRQTFSARPVQAAGMKSQVLPIHAGMAKEHACFTTGR